MRGRVFLLLLDDLLHDDIEAAMEFDGVLPPESASFAGQAAISKTLACHSSPDPLLDRFLSQEPQVPPPVGKPEQPRAGRPEFPWIRMVSFVWVSRRILTVID